MNCGSGPNGELTMLDVLAIVSFLISIINLDENLSQSDKADLQRSLQEEMQKALGELHSHLTTQDEKINKILELLEGKQNADNW